MEWLNWIKIGKRWNEKVCFSGTSILNLNLIITNITYSLGLYIILSSKSNNINWNRFLFLSYLLHSFFFHVQSETLISSNMKGLFKPKPRTPTDIVRQTRDLLLFFDRNTESRDSKREEKVCSRSYFLFRQFFTNWNWWNHNYESQLSPLCVFFFLLLSVMLFLNMIFIFCIHIFITNL